MDDLLLFNNFFSAEDLLLFNNFLSEDLFLSNNFLTEADSNNFLSEDLVLFNPLSGAGGTGREVSIYAFPITLSD
eukprot:CAMPEP_0171030224 /NCGR_PEP_ID=MMETSP0736-20130129/36904_1 /TAXON_ID=186038 /ORGANISM="Fragilariopsis kerguelensis, Strain L26-C5" /LENGTH=74 /DNA_ID=CAMNT_0011472217 /DNA_START=314 /DNA_END=538 /DNA_ORIENTATION=+